MGFFEKIKNALFEEEYVEVEDKPKKQKKEVPKKDVERPIAKKVILPKKEEVKVEELDEEEYLDEDFEIQPNNVKEPEEVKEDFKVMDDDDFRVEEEYRPSEPKIVKVIDKDEPVKEEVHYYQGKKEKQPYGIDEANRLNVPEYGRNSDVSQYSGAYERKEDRTHFKPSPIISPIYGILDKNYKKEDVVTKREVRLTSSYARENLSVDDVRKKAYGSLSDDLAKEFDDEPKKSTTFEVEEVKEEDENLLVDLSDDKEKPAVKEVTMGDALEYFEDLGLEYNVDYVDASKEKATGRRSDNYESLDTDIEKVEEVAEEVNEEKDEEPVMEPVKELEVDVDSDDNLFDLIDSMYKEND